MAIVWKSILFFTFNRLVSNAQFFFCQTYVCNGTNERAKKKLKENLYIYTSKQGLPLPTIVYGMFEAGSSFHGGWGTAGVGGGLIAIFRGFFASAGKMFVLAGALGTALSFYGV